MEQNAVAYFRLSVDDPCLQNQERHRKHHDATHITTIGQHSSKRQHTIVFPIWAAQTQSQGLQTELFVTIIRPYNLPKRNFRAGSSHFQSQTIRSPIMFFFGLLPAMLLAVTKHTAVTWFIDGNNLMGHKGTPRDRETIAAKVKPIKAAERVVLVFDGQRGREQDGVEDDGIFRSVYLREGISADDYILDEIRALIPLRPRRKVQVVTADRALRRKVLETKPVVYGVVNPVVFWKKYLPRLCGFKNDYANTPPEES